MKILITNDDGIKAPGIRKLAELSMQLGEGWVVAPKSQCSAMSQRITLFEDIKKLNINPNNKLHRSKVKSLRGKLNSCRAIEPNIFSNIHNQLSKIEKKLAKYKCN